MDQQSDKTRLNAELIGYHLDLLDAEGRARVEAAFPDKAALDAACNRVANCLRVLDADETPVPPTNLVAGIMSRVEQSKQTIPFPSQSVVADEAANVRPARSMMRLRELIGLAAAIALFFGVFVPGYRTSQIANQQGPSMASFPEMGRSNGGSGFQLVNGDYATPSTIVCPNQHGGNPNMLHNAVAPYVLTHQLKDGDLAADGDQRSRPIPLQVGGSHRSAEDLINRLSRQGLHGTWTIRFYTAPRGGVQDDEIYRLIGVQEYTGQARPAQRSDACLVP